jgi:Rieske Fe-S protein
MQEPSADSEESPDRRTFLSSASSFAMAGGMVAGYGTLAYMAGRFLYPSEGRKLAWLYVIEVERMKPGDAMRYRTPAGQTVTITRRSDTGTVEDFLALSSTCPHLGCQVHWEGQNNRFFCPCHSGTFDPDGKAVSGPPAEAKQSLPHFALQIERGLLFIEVPVETI